MTSERQEAANRAERAPLDEAEEPGGEERREENW